MKLTNEQADDLAFPIGCPVWYKTEEPPLMKQGVIESVFFNYDTKDLIYEVAYKDGEMGTVVEEVSEQKLAYAANCPVTIDAGGHGSVEGTVLLCKPSPGDPSKFVYTVMIGMEGSHARFEHGIDATRVKYRKEKKDTTPVTPDAAEKEQLSASKIDAPDTKVSALTSAVGGGGAMPSSITCDSVAKSSRDREEKRMPDVMSPLTAPTVLNDKDDAPLEIKKSYQLQQRTNDASSAAGGSTHSRNSDPMFCRVHFPSWLLHNRELQDLVPFLTQGSRTSPNILTSIGQKTNCVLEIRGGRSPRDNDPIHVHIRATGGSDPKTDIVHAKRELEDGLVTFIGDDLSKGRLFYDLAFSCPFLHRQYPTWGPIGTTVEQRSPYKDINTTGGPSFMSIVELPYVRDSTGRRIHHGHYIVLPSFGVLRRLNRETGCIVKVCGKDFNAPMKYSDPHVWVWGYAPRKVDAAVEILKAAIREHRQHCNCFLEREK